MGIDGSPSAHAKGGSRIAPSLRRGLGYLALDPDDTVSSFLRLLAEAHTPFLWLTTERPQAPAEGGEVLRVTTIRGAGTADPRRLQDIRAVATTFFDERGPGAFVIYCLDPLVLHSVIDRFLRFVSGFHEYIDMCNGLLLGLESSWE